MNESPSSLSTRTVYKKQGKSSSSPLSGGHRLQFVKLLQRNAHRRLHTRTDPKGSFLVDAPSSLAPGTGTASSLIASVATAVAAESDLPSIQEAFGRPDIPIDTEVSVNSISQDVWWLVVFSVLANAVIISMCIANAAYIQKRKSFTSVGSLIRCTKRAIESTLHPRHRIPENHRCCEPTPPLRRPSSNRQQGYPVSVPQQHEQQAVGFVQNVSVGSKVVVTNTTGTQSSAFASVPTLANPAKIIISGASSSPSAAVVRTTIPVVGSSLASDIDRQSMLLSSASVHAMFRSPVTANVLGRECTHDVMHLQGSGNASKKQSSQRCPPSIEHSMRICTGHSNVASLHRADTNVPIDVCRGMFENAFSRGTLLDSSSGRDARNSQGNHGYENWMT